MSRHQNNNRVVNILIVALIFSFGILSALSVALIKNVSSVLQHTQSLQEDLAHEISLTQKCIEKIDSKRDQELLKKVVNTSNNSVVAVNYEGKIIAWSHGAAQILGYEKLDAIGRSLHSLIPDSIRNNHNTKFTAKMSDPTDTQIFERYLSCKALTKSGEEIDVNVTVIGVPNGISVGTIELKAQ